MSRPDSSGDLSGGRTCPAPEAPTPPALSEWTPYEGGTPADGTCRHCPGCGGRDLSRFTRPSIPGSIDWRIRCRSCDWQGEILPDRETVARTCAKASPGPGRTIAEAAAEDGVLRQAAGR